MGFRWAWLSVACAAAAALPYLGTLGAGFLGFDDPIFLLQQPVWTDPSPAALRDCFARPIWGSYHPLHQASYLVDRLAWGPVAWGVRLDQLLLHAACAAALVALARRLALPPLAAGLAGLAFALHPAHVENVAWISQRKDLLSGLFALGATLVWLGPRPHGVADRRAPLPGPGRIAATFALLLLGALAKSVAVVAVAWLLVLLLVRGQLRTGLPRLAPLLLLAVLALLVHHAAQRDVGAALARPPLLSHARFVLRTTGHYLGAAVVPTSVTPIHPGPGPFPEPADGLAALLVAAAAVLALRSWQQGDRRAAAWVLMFLLALAPTSGIVPLPAYVQDRYLFLPSVPLALGLGQAAAGWVRGRPERRRIATAVAAIALGGAAFATSRYAAAWTSDLALWSWAASRAPGDPTAQERLAHALLRRGRPEDVARAEELLRRALATDPRRLDANQRLAELLLARGDLAGARASLRAGLEASSNMAYWAGVQLVVLEIGQDDLAAAAAALEATRRRAPRQAHDLLAAEALLELAHGRPAEAAARWRAALEQVPGWRDGWARLALAERLAGRPEASAEAAGRAGDAAGAARAWLQLDAGDPGAAAATLAALPADDLEAELARARLDLARGDEPGARDRLRRMLARGDPWTRRRTLLEPTLRPLLALD